MTLREFVASFANQFEETEIELFTPETRYKDLPEWSSLTALSIISMVDEEMDKPLTGAELRSAGTIENLYNLLQEK